MRFKPVGAREFHNYAFIIITEDEEEKRRPGDTRRCFNRYHTGQILICDMITNSPIEVGTHGKPGKGGCESIEILWTLRDAVNRAHVVVDAANGAYAGRKAYRYLVITDTDSRPPSNRPEYGPYYEVGQIVVCDVRGLPMEIGTFMKPGRINCQSTAFLELDKAINFSYLLTGAGWGSKKKSYKDRKRNRRPERHRKFRHQA